MISEEIGCRVPVRDRAGDVVAWALVDPTDAALAGSHVWHLHASGYAVRYVTVDAKRRAIFLHREILGLPHAYRTTQADHINGDGLDNRRANLRVATHAQNMQNRPSHRGARSCHRGVYWAQGRWRAEARLGGRKHHIGYFTDEAMAGAAAAAWRAAHMPFATARAS